MEEKMRQNLWTGVVVMILLSTMTLGEYFIGLVAYNWWAPLLSIAALKAFFIIRDYMHIGRVFNTAQAENEGH